MPKTFFCDTSVLVAASVQNHPHAEASLAVIDRAGPSSAFCATHSLAEMYAVLTALRTPRQKHPADVLRAVERAAALFTIVPLSTKDYLATLRFAAEQHVQSGQVCDALILSAAEQSQAEVIYTWNVKHFQAIARQEIRERIRTP